LERWLTSLIINVSSMQRILPWAKRAHDEQSAVAAADPAGISPGEQPLAPFRPGTETVTETIMLDGSRKTTKTTVNLDGSKTIEETIVKAA
jgi:hypothetical protein